MTHGGRETSVDAPSRKRGISLGSFLGFRALTPLPLSPRILTLTPSDSQWQITCYEYTIVAIRPQRKSSVTFVAPPAAFPALSH